MLLCLLGLLLVFIGRVSQCVYCVCYVDIGVLNLLGKEVCDKSGIEGEKRENENANLANVNEETKDTEEGVIGNDDEHEVGVNCVA